VVGVADERRVPLLAGALEKLGTKHALVVHGTGMDEISPLAPTMVVEIREGLLSEWSVDPARFGYKGLDEKDLAGGTPEANARTVLATLSGKAAKAARGAVVLNAGAALYVGGIAKRYEDGVALAEAAIDSGAGLSALERLRSVYSASPPA
jgi:anthranilate phosphoribosyltransferase